MSNYWSTCIQTTEELYRSRALRFHDDNRDIWLRAIGVQGSGAVLEAGCGGGVFCHRLKSYMPGLDITGIDLDAGHIAYARNKAAELGLACTFVQGYATAMPFADNMFDMCFSYTVAEHIEHTSFFAEQYRVLKMGGRITMLSVRMRLGLKDDTPAPEDAALNALLEKAWSHVAELNARYHIGAFEVDEHQYPRELEQAGFHHVGVDLFTVVDYAPDSADVPRARALEQIACRRLGSIDSLQKALNYAPDALTPQEQRAALALIDRRHARRLRAYEAGDRLWDFTASTVLAVSGVK